MKPAKTARPFTNDEIRKPVTERDIIRDVDHRDSVKGLFALLYPANSRSPKGTRTFHQRFWNKDRQDWDRVVVGEFIDGVFGVPQAREVAEKLLGERITSGTGFIANRRKQAGVAKADAENGDLTFNTVADEFVEWCKETVKKKGGRTAPRIEAIHKVISYLVPLRETIGHVRFREVETDQLRKIIRAFWESDRTSMGNKVRFIACRVYKWASTERNYIHPLKNPCLGLPGPRDEFPKERYLGPDEIRRLWWGVDKEGAPVERRVALGIRLMLATALRPTEVAEALRDEVVVNEEGGRELHVPPERAKKRRPIHCPTTSLADEVIDELLAQPVNEKGALFELGGQGALMTDAVMTSTLSGVTKDGERTPGLCDFLGFNAPCVDKHGKPTTANVEWTPFTSHVLRASSSTLLQDDGVEAHKRAQVLDHQKEDKDKGATTSTAVYARAKNLAHLKRPTLERLEQLIRMSIDPARPEGMKLRTWEKKLKANATVDVVALQRQIADLQAQVKTAMGGTVVAIRAA